MDRCGAMWGCHGNRPLLKKAVLIGVTIATVAHKYIYIYVFAVKAMCVAGGTHYTYGGTSL